jgi:type I restriction enzyme R subunit
LAKGNVLKSQNTRDRFQLTKEDGTSFYVRFLIQRITAKLYQVTNQISLEGSYKNRYDVTLLVNGLPLVQIELKRSGIEIKEALTKSIYQTILWSNGLFQYVQLFVISNGVNTNIWPINCNRSNKPSFGQMPIIKTSPVNRVCGCFKPKQLGKMMRIIS